jgi:vacuolar protein sorting-associated protein IST1
LESRLKVLEEIALENEIVLNIEGASSTIPEEKINVNIQQNQPEPDVPINIVSSEIKVNRQILPEDPKRVEDFTDSMKGRRKYKDVADAAQAAFESAAYAAAAARAAVELSRSGSFDSHDKQNSPGSSQPNQSKHTSKIVYNDKIHPNQNSESEEDEIVNNNTTKLDRSMSYSSSDSGNDIMKEAALNSEMKDRRKALGKEIAFDESDDDKIGNEQVWSPNTKKSNEFEKFDSDKFHYEEGSRTEERPRINLANRPLSVRTKRVFGR